MSIGAVVALAGAVAYVGPAAVVATASPWRPRCDARASAGDRLPGCGSVVRFAGIVTGACVGVVMFCAGQALLAPAAVVTGYLLAVLLSELASVPRPSGPVRTASLRPRSASQYVPPWTTLAVGVTGVVALTAALAFALAPRLNYLTAVSPVAQRAPAAVERTSPLVVAGLAAVAVILAIVLGRLILRKVAEAPMSDSRHGFDDAARRRCGRAVVGAVLAVELLSLAGCGLAAGDALSELGVDGELVHAASRVLTWAGLGLGFTALGVWAALNRREPTQARPARAMTRSVMS